MARRRFIQDEQLELFTIAANTSDIRGKQVRDLMVWGTFNIGNRHKKAIQHRQGEYYLDVTAGEGSNIATYHDNDLLIFLTSHLVQAVNRGDKTAQKIYFTANEYFRFAATRNIGGNRYDQIWNSLYRLNDTFVHTNIDLGGGNIKESRWNWLPEIHRVKSTKTGKSLGFEVVIADPIYKAATALTPHVLTLDRRYFDLRSGFLKFLYLYARKSAGTLDREWYVSEKLLHSRSGSSMPISQFRKMLKRVTDAGTLCEYDVKATTSIRGGAPERGVLFERNPYALQTVHKTTIVLE
jgi:plasmid replication initiation protein